MFGVESRDSWRWLQGGWKEPPWCGSEWTNPTRWRKWRKELGRAGGGGRELEREKEKKKAAATEEIPVPQLRK